VVKVREYRDNHCLHGPRMSKYREKGDYKNKEP
jgi:hypothetical protein